jgi:GR25 family glycosyltransferase involved in LPS biosynthesis
MDTKRSYYDIKDTPTWYVDKIPAFCINLERRSDRWAEFTAQAGVKQLPNVKRFLAVDGSTIDYMTDPRIPMYTKKNIKNTTRRAHEEISTVGAIGCALSHIGIWEWIVQNQAAVTMVFEDDAKIPPNFAPYMNQLIEKSPTLKDTHAWELCVLTHQTVKMKPVAGDPYINTTQGFVGFQCYFITLDCAKRFLKEAYVLHLHIDLWTAVFKQLYGLKLICPVNFSVQQRRSITDIQEINRCKLCDIPSNFSKTHDMVRIEEKWLVQATEIALSIAFLYAGYSYITRKR